MPLVPKNASCESTGKAGGMELKPRSKAVLVPRLSDDKKKPKGLIPKPLESKPSGGLIPKASAIKQPISQPVEEIEEDNSPPDAYDDKQTLKPKKKEVDHQKSLDKWHKVLENGSICLAEEMMGRTKMRVVFNPILEHFLLQYVDLENKAHSMKMTFTVATMKLFRTALRRAEKAGIIKYGHAIQQAEEDK